MSQADLSFEQLAKCCKINYTIDKKAKIILVSHLGQANVVQFVNAVKAFARSCKLTKISVKVKQQQALYLFQQGFKVEASIMAYDGVQDALYVVYQFEESTLTEDEHSLILEYALKDSHSCLVKQFPHIEVKADNALSHQVNRQHVFICQDHNFVHPNEKQKFYAKIDGEVMATANAIRLLPDNVVEFVDFTALKSELMSTALRQLVSDMTDYYQALGVLTAYALIPASHLEINNAFARNRFEFGGRLVNQVLMDDKLDSLNTWFRPLTKEGKGG